MRTGRRADVVKSFDELVDALAHETKTQAEHGVWIGRADAGISNGNCCTGLMEAEITSHGLSRATGQENCEQKASC